MKKLRDGFSVISAILIMVLISTILVMSLSLSSKSVKQTTDVYLKAQAEILARSATEYALLAISGHEINATNGCIDNILINYNGTHDANISIMYIGNGLPVSTATPPEWTILANNIATEESDVTVIIDTVITVAEDVTDEPIRIHRRTIQKP